MTYDKTTLTSLFEKYIRKLRITPAWDIKLEFVEDPMWPKTGDFKAVFLCFGALLRGFTHQRNLFCLPGQKRFFCCFMRMNMVQIIKQIIICEE